MQPGDTISPVGSLPDAPIEPPQPPAPLSPAPPQPIPEIPHVPDAPPTPVEPQTTTSVPSDQGLSWTASEFIEHQKPQGWYITLAIGAIIVSALLYFILKDVVTVVVIAVAALLFGVVGARKPRSLSYVLSQTGLQVGERVFSYANFKSFSVIEEGAIDSIQLYPLKKFMPPISLYFPPDQEQVIVETLADYLPHEDNNHDAIDRLMKRVRF